MIKINGRKYDGKVAEINDKREVFLDGVYVNTLTSPDLNISVSGGGCVISSARQREMEKSPDKLEPTISLWERFKLWLYVKGAFWIWLIRK